MLDAFELVDCAGSIPWLSGLRSSELVLAMWRQEGSATCRDILFASRQAAARLEKDGWLVIGAYLSPTHDDYVQPKCKNLSTLGLSGRFRYLIAKEAVRGDSLVAASAWEISQTTFVDYPEVSRRFPKQAELEGSWRLC